MTVKLGLIKLLHRQYDMCEEAYVSAMLSYLPLRYSVYIAVVTQILPSGVPSRKVIMRLSRLLLYLRRFHRVSANSFRCSRKPTQYPFSQVRCRCPWLYRRRRRSFLCETYSEFHEETIPQVQQVRLVNSNFCDHYLHASALLNM